MWVNIEGDDNVGTVLKVTLSTIFVAPMGGDGCCTIFIRPESRELTTYQEMPGIHRTVSELSLCLKSPATQGFLVEALVDSPAVEEMSMRDDGDSYSVTLFLTNGTPLVFSSEGNDLGMLLATALYEVYSLQDRTVGPRLICH